MLKKTVIAVSVYSFISALVITGAEAANTNISIDSADLEPLSIDKKSDPESLPIIYANDEVAVGFNEDGDPNVGMKF